MSSCRPIRSHPNHIEVAMPQKPSRSPATLQVEDLIVGTGQAGKPLASALAEAGRQVAIVERDARVGGTCVVRGCTPTKTMVASARVAHLAGRAGDYGVETGQVRVNLQEVRKRKRAIVDEWSRGSRKGLEGHDTLHLVMGEARFTGPRQIQVSLPDGGMLDIEARRIFLNTGGRPRIPDLPGLRVPTSGEEDMATPPPPSRVLDSTSIMELGEVPDHLVVLGGGFIGLEFAQMFRRFGARVTVLERNDSLASREDEDVAQALLEILRGEGIRILCDASASQVEAGPEGGIRVHIEKGAPIEGSHLLVAAGRVPNTDTLDPAAAGVELDPQGYITVNHRLETSVEGVWALGDVAGSPPFTHMAYDDYRVVKRNLLGDGKGSTRGRLLTYTVFTDPQLGRVGLTEREAREAGHDVKLATLPMSRVARAMEMDETRGLMKAVVDAESNQVLGVAILGVEGGEVAAVLQVAMMGKLPWTVLRDSPIAHPTLAESLNNLFATLEG